MIAFASDALLIVTGDLPRDPESKKVGDQSVCNISIPVNRSWKDKDGEQQKTTTWYNIVVWGKDADHLVKFGKKGTNVTFHCSDFKATTYTNKAGDEVADVKFTAFKIIFNANTRQKDESRDDHEEPEERPSRASRNDVKKERKQESNNNGYDDDIPF